MILAGKTGTAEIDKNNNVNSWFVGYGEKDGKKISSINKKIRNAVDKEIKLKDDLKRIELFVNKYYDKYYELKELFKGDGKEEK